MGEASTASSACTNPMACIHELQVHSPHMLHDTPCCQSHLRHLWTVQSQMLRTTPPGRCSQIAPGRDRSHVSTQWRMRGLGWELLWWHVSCGAAGRLYGCRRLGRCRCAPQCPPWLCADSVRLPCSLRLLRWPRRVLRALHAAHRQCAAWLCCMTLPAAPFCQGAALHWCSGCSATRAGRQAWGCQSSIRLHLTHSGALPLTGNSLHPLRVGHLPSSSLSEGCSASSRPAH
jgi:hypothetical protein